MRFGESGTIAEFPKPDQAAASHATIDALAGIEAEAEDREDDELAIAECLIPHRAGEPPERDRALRGPVHVRHPTCASSAACGPYRGRNRPVVTPDVTPDKREGRRSDRISC